MDQRNSRRFGSFDRIFTDSTCSNCRGKQIERTAQIARKRRHAYDACVQPDAAFDLRAKPFEACASGSKRRFEIEQRGDRHSRKARFTRWVLRAAAIRNQPEFKQW